MGKVGDFLHPNNAGRRKANAATAKQATLQQQAAAALEIARQQKEAAIARAAELAQKRKEEIASWYAEEVAKAREQYANQETEYHKAIDDLSRAYVQHTTAIEQEFQAQQSNIEEQQNALEITDDYTCAFSELLQMAQMYSETEQLLDNVEYAKLHDLFNAAVNTAQQNIYAAYAVEKLVLEQEYGQKLLEVTDTYEIAIANVREVWCTYQEEYVASLAELDATKTARLAEVEANLKQQIADIELAYTEHVAAINKELNDKLTQINDNLAKQLKQLKRATRGTLISILAATAAGAAAYFSGGLLTGFSTYISEAVKKSLALSSLATLANLANGSNKVSLSAGINLEPPSKPRYVAAIIDKVPVKVNKPVEQRAAVQDSSAKRVAVITKHVQNTSANASTVELAAITPNQHSIIDWFKLASQALAGKTSPEVIQWQMANRHATPNLAKIIDELRDFAPQQVVSGVIDGGAERVTGVVKFPLAEAQRIYHQEMPHTVRAVVMPIQATGKFIGEEAARLRLDETTKTRQYVAKATDFVAAEYRKVKQGDETRTVFKGKQLLHTVANVPPYNFGYHIGTATVDAALFSAVPTGLAVAQEASALGFSARVQNMVTTASNKISATMAELTANFRPMTPAFANARAQATIPAMRVDALTQHIHGCGAAEVVHDVTGQATAVSMVEVANVGKRLTKTEVIEYLQNIDKIPVKQVYEDLQKLGLELYEPPVDGVYKFIHWRNDIRRVHELKGVDSPIHTYVKPKLENSKFIVEIHKGKGGLDVDHMHITDAYENVYDKCLNNLTDKLRRENPSWHENKIQDKVKKLPEAHIAIKEFLKLNMRPENV